MKRKTIDPANLSVLDLLTNALAAMLILMFVLAAFRPPPGRHRTMNTLLLDVSLEDSLGVDSVMVKSPAEKGPVPKFGAEVLKLDRGGTASRVERNIRRSYERIGESDSLDQVMIYRPVGQTHRQIAVVRHPGEGKWEVGLLYARHPELDLDPRPTKGRIRAWSGISGQIAVLDTTVSLFGPSDMSSHPITVHEAATR